MEAEDLNLAPQYVMRDNDTKFTAQFDAAIESSGAKIKRNTPVSPNLRAHVERFIQSLKQECLDKFVIVAERHLNYVNREWRLHFNRARPHSASDHLPPDFVTEPPTVSTIQSRDVVCTSRLGRLLRSYPWLGLPVHRDRWLRIGAEAVSPLTRSPAAEVDWNGVRQSVIARHAQPPSTGRERKPSSARLFRRVLPKRGIRACDFRHATEEHGLKELWSRVLSVGHRRC